MSERLSVIETKLAYHENNLAELNQVIYKQERRIESLEAQLKKVLGQVGELGMATDPNQFQKPPHY